MPEILTVGAATGRKAAEVNELLPEVDAILSSTDGYKPQSGLEETLFTAVTSSNGSEDVSLPWKPIFDADGTPKGIITTPFWDPIQAKMFIYIIERENFYLIAPERPKIPGSKVSLKYKMAAATKFLKGVRTIYNTKGKYTGVVDFKSTINDVDDTSNRDSDFEVMSLGIFDTRSMGRLIEMFSRIKVPTPPRRR